MGRFGKQIRLLRQKRNLTVRALADAIGKSAGYISHIEVRDEIPSAEMICTISDVLHVKPQTLLAIARADLLQQTEEKLDKKASEALTLYRRSKR